MDEPLMIVPNGFEVSAKGDDGTVRLRFNRDGAQSWEIYLVPQSIPLLVAELEKAAGPLQPTARPEDIRPGQAYDLEGQAVRARPEGGAVLTLFVRLSGQRGVELPIALPPRDLSHLVEALNPHR